MPDFSKPAAQCCHPPPGTPLGEHAPGCNFKRAVDALRDGATRVQCLECGEVMVEGEIPVTVCAYCNARALERTPGGLLIGNTTQSNKKQTPAQSDPQPHSVMDETPRPTTMEEADLVSHCLEKSRDQFPAAATSGEALPSPLYPGCRRRDREIEKLRGQLAGASATCGEDEHHPSCPSHGRGDEADVICNCGAYDG